MRIVLEILAGGCSFGIKERAISVVSHGVGVVCSCMKCGQVCPCRLIFADRGSPPSLPAKHFLLFGLNDKHKLGMSLFIFGLYTMHNEMRHQPDRTGFQEMLYAGLWGGSFTPFCTLGVAGCFRVAS